MSDDTTARWRRVQEVFDKVADLPPHERDARLAELCGDDQRLRADVGLLLDADAVGGEALEHAALLSLKADEEFAHEEWVGRRAGAYRLLRLIGKGGMGAVFEAERADATFEKRVAVKLIRAGMDSAGIVARFRRERRILAALEHPNIAALVDGGATEDGRPYLVMEYVDGTPIDCYCDTQGLALEERVDLVRAVCDAVGYAHRKLIIHRDLKPANILVTADGRVKLLDFGVAKLLADTETDEPVTALAPARALTPSYAAPEQLLGEDVTTSTDVYGLGAVLYELLCGGRLRERVSTALADLVRAAEVEPPRPSTLPSAAAAGLRGESSAERLAQRLSGDLDHIALMALRREPERRYASPDHLAADLRCWQEGLPGGARPDTAGYRLRKFMRRNRTRVAAAVLVFLTLVAGIASTAWQSRQARQEAEAAQLARRTSDRINLFLQQMLGAADPSWYSTGERVGPNTTMAEVLRFAAATVNERLAAEPIVRAGVLRTIGNSYRALGVDTAAEPLLRASVELYRRTIEPPHADLAQALNELGFATYMLGDYVEAESRVREALGMLRTLGDDHADEYLKSVNLLGLVLWRAGRLAEAEPYIEETVELARDRGQFALLAIGYNNLGLMREALGDDAGAEAAYHQATAVFDEHLERETFEESTALINYAALLAVARKRAAEALSFAMRADSVALRALGAEHPRRLMIVAVRARIRDYAGDSRAPKPRHARPIRPCCGPFRRTTRTRPSPPSPVP